VRMLDGRIDAQGTISELRATGVLEGIAKAEAAEVAEQESELEKPGEADVAAGSVVAENGVSALVNAEAQVMRKYGGRTKPRKLIEQEKREEGSVKWAIYNTYLKAS
jgi:hypothetical protein